MSDFSQIIQETPIALTTAENDTKKPNWARLRGKILGHASQQHTGRQRSHTDNVRPQDEDIQAFLGVAPVPPTAIHTRRHSAPRIDGSAVSRLTDVVTLATKAEQERAWEDRQYQVRYKKPPRRAGLKVVFATSSPEVIGEGGEDAELPSSQCAKGSTIRNAQRVRAGTLQSISNTGEGERSSEWLATQPIDSFQYLANAPRKPLPATPGPSIGDKVAIVAGAIADLSLSTNQGYFPQMPVTLRQPGANAFANTSDVHPALRERPNTAPSKGTDSLWGDAATLPALHYMTINAPERQQQRFQNDVQKAFFIDKQAAAPMLTEQPDMATFIPQQGGHRLHPSLPNIKPEDPALFSAPSSNPSGRRPIPSPLAMSFSHSSDAIQTMPMPTENIKPQPSTPNGSPQKRMRAQTAYRPQTPRKVPTPPSAESPERLQQRSRPELEAVAAQEASLRRNASQPYPMLSKGFVQVRRAVGSRPGSSSSSRPTTAQSQTHANAQIIGRPSSSNTRPDSKGSGLSPTKPGTQPEMFGAVPDRPPRLPQLPQLDQLVGMESHFRPVSRDQYYAANDPSPQGERMSDHVRQAPLPRLDRVVGTETHFRPISRDQAHTPAGTHLQSDKRLEQVPPSSYTPQLPPLDRLVGTTSYFPSSSVDQASVSHTESSRSGTNQDPPVPCMDSQMPAASTAVKNPRPTEQEANNAALFVFTSRTKELHTLIRNAKPPFDADLLPSDQWLRIGVWWLLGARTDLAASTIPPTGQPNVSVIRACLNLSKVWYIVSDVVTPRLKEVASMNVHGSQSYSSEISQLFALTDALVVALKELCLSMLGNGKMPSGAVSVSEVNLKTTDVVFVVADEFFPRDIAELIGLLKRR